MARRWPARLWLVLAAADRADHAPAGAGRQDGAGPGVAADRAPAGAGPEPRQDAAPDQAGAAPGKAGAAPDASLAARPMPASVDAGVIGRDWSAVSMPSAEEARVLQTKGKGRQSWTTTTTTTQWTSPYPTYESEDTFNCILNNWQGYCECQLRCMMGEPYLDTLLWAQGGVELACAALPTNATLFNQMHSRVGLALHACSWTFLHCNAKCADCIDCRREEDEDLCAEMIEVRSECSKDLIRDLEIQHVRDEIECEVICPQKLMYPKCTSCCDCITYSDSNGLRALPAPTPPPYQASLDFDDTYMLPESAGGMETEPQPPHVLESLKTEHMVGVSVVLVLGLLKLMEKKGLFHEWQNKSVRVEVHSKHSDEVFRGEDVSVLVAQDPHSRKIPKPDVVGAEQLAAYPHPVFRPVNQPERPRLGAVKPLPKVEPKPPPEPPKTRSWHEIMLEEQLREQAELHAIDEQDREICATWLSGVECTEPRCPYRHLTEKEMRRENVKRAKPKPVRCVTPQREAADRFDFSKRDMASQGRAAGKSLCKPVYAEPLFPPNAIPD